ncbi:TlpA family protein disulfide reductase [Ekhidna sp.]
MKNLALYSTLLLITLSSFAQLEVTLYGDVNDSTLIKRKQSMEEKGWTVQIRPEDSRGDDSGDQEFINRWTNKKLPAFELTDMNGKNLSNDDLKGKMVHINFWSVTCKPCIEEFPELNELKNKYGDEVIFLAIAPESDKKVNKVLKKHALEYRSFANAELFFEELGIDGYPKNLFIKEDGTIEKIIDGTHYKIEQVDDKATMVPDNFQYYDKVLDKMTNAGI